MHCPSLRYLTKHNLLQYQTRLHAVQPAFKNDGLQTELRQYLHGLLSDAAESLPTTFCVRLLYEAKCSESLDMTGCGPLCTLHPITVSLDHHT